MDNIVELSASVDLDLGDISEIFSIGLVPMEGEINADLNGSLK